jgi:hypothetical protein
MSVIKKILFLFFIIVAISLNAQTNYVLKNETVLFSFKTTSGKTLTINKDKENKYLVYRFGTKKKIELQYPNEVSDSWSKFKYSYYLRGGGIENEGLELNYIQFTNANFKYVVYSTDYSGADKPNIGIKVINVKTNKTVTVPGIYATQKGSLMQFRDDDLIGQSDETFD